MTIPPPILERLQSAQAELGGYDPALINQAISKPFTEWLYLHFRHPHDLRLEHFVNIRKVYNEWWEARAVVKSIYRRTRKKSAA